MDKVEYIELFWDCPQCGQAHISAVFNAQGNRCPHCLHWRTEDVPLYEAADSQIITDPALIDRQPFWVCKVCHAVNEDTGLAANLLQCGNCDSYQTSEVGGITGDSAADQAAPDPVAVGAPVAFKQNNSAGNTQSLRQPSSGSQKSGGGFSRWVAGLIGLSLVGGGIVVSLAVAAQIRERSPLQVQVTDLVWTVETEVQELKTLTRQAWAAELPSGATITKSERRQQGTRQEQRGVRTVLVPERYQSGTRTETYMDSERYQSGTQEKCKTTSQGNGVGKRTCRDVPVYSTRQVQRTRSVPVYSTRQVPIQEPIWVDVPVYSNWITYRIKEWVPVQTYSQTGRDDAPKRTPTVKLTQQPPQKIAATRTICRLSGDYSTQPGWFQSPQSTAGSWTLPCSEYDRINIGDRVELRQESADAVHLVQRISP